VADATSNDDDDCVDGNGSGNDGMGYGDNTGFTFTVVHAGVTVRVTRIVMNCSSAACKLADVDRCCNDLDSTRLNVFIVAEVVVNVGVGSNDDDDDDVFWRCCPIVRRPMK
jgi:hypothetical protein